MKRFHFLLTFSILSITLACCDKIQEKRAEEAGYAEEYKALKEGRSLSDEPEGKPAPLAVKDDLKLVVTPVQDPVAPGTHFEATLEVDNLPEGVIPQYSGTGWVAKETVSGGRTAKFKISLHEGLKGAKEKQQEFEVKAIIAMEDGSKHELKHKGSFTIRMSEVIVNPNPSNPLYANCGNTLIVEVPSLGELFNPVYKASECQVILPPSDKHKCVLIPRGKATTFEVSSLSNGLQIMLSRETYVVQPPPPPQLEVILGGASLKPGGKLPKAGNVLVKINPDKDFRAKMPKDSRYALGNLSLETIENGKSSVIVKVSGTGKDATQGIPLPLDGLKSAKSGIKVRIVVDKVDRLNFQNTPYTESGSFVWEGQVK